MKKIKIAYWIVTIIFAGFMIMSSVPDILLSAEAVGFMKGLGYPEYLTRFIGIAKVLGCIAILVPGFPRLKEWAYAGLFFDLVGATYSVICVAGLNGGSSLMFLFLAFALAAYVLWRKKETAS